jgi:hypothetical protein
MADNWNVVPPPPKRIATVDLAQFSALRAIVMTMVTIMANEQERAGHGSAQSWINMLGSICSEAVLKSGMVEGDMDIERFRQLTVEKINEFLGSIKYPREIDQTN